MKKLLVFTIIAFICTILLCAACITGAFLAKSIPFAAFCGVCGGFDLALTFVYIKLYIDIVLELKSKGE